MKIVCACISPVMPLCTGFLALANSKFLPVLCSCNVQAAKPARIRRRPCWKYWTVKKWNSLSGWLPNEIASSCKLQQLPASCHDTMPPPTADAGGSGRPIETRRQEISCSISVMSASALVSKSRHLGRLGRNIGRICGNIISAAERGHSAMRCQGSLSHRCPSQRQSVHSSNICGRGRPLSPWLPD